MVAELVGPGVTLPAVGDDCRPWLDVLGDEGVQRGSGPVAQDRHPAPAVPARLDDFNGHADQGFLALRPAAGQSRFLATDVGLIHSTVRVSRSRPGRTSTDRNRCSIAQAVWYEPISSGRCRLNAETPSFCAANIQQAVNHTVNGLRRRSNSVPAVAEVRDPQLAHL